MPKQLEIPFIIPIDYEACFVRRQVNLIHIKEAVWNFVKSILESNLSHIVTKTPASLTEENEPSEEK